MESLLNFMEELIKRKKGEKNCEDLYAFQSLGEAD
jgi:hypothetical protein